ncbi:2Fe-2S iron-sulfur cluster-binding protein [uncultured Shewanella sp.]|uniref:2Fe-2S iron-sulfur cluster-binding protein n=1 Tax=uncultured Shewanella sp. TaxID=173975 RepID=UPI00262E4375|nr:2Fe-2S iron-sulfur cluster-binding protein [uncultured Shewanella sp.]
MHKVSIPTTGEDFLLPDRAYLTDAEELQLTGLKFGCRKGACGICAIKVIAGNNKLSVAKQRETKLLARMGHSPDSVRLACQCQLYGDITIVAI